MARLYASTGDGIARLDESKGSIFTRNATATLRLDAEGVTDSIEATFEEREGETSFVLAVALTLPPDDEFYSVVELSGTARIVSPSAPWTIRSSGWLRTPNSWHSPSTASRCNWSEVRSI